MVHGFAVPARYPSRVIVPRMNRANQASRPAPPRGTGPAPAGRERRVPVWLYPEEENGMIRAKWPMALVTGLALLGLTIGQAAACTGITLATKDGGAVRGRTMEFAQPLNSSTVLFPRGMEIVGTTPEANTPGLTWDVKYAAAGLNGVDLPIIIDGVNEKGLSGGIFYFPNYAQFQDVQPADYGKSIAPWQLMTWMLTSFATVDEVKTALPGIMVAQVEFAAWGIIPPMHYYLADASGGRIAVEYIGGELNVYDAPLGVFTNAPTFDWHMTNLNNYVGLDPSSAKQVTVDEITLNPVSTGANLVGLPGDFSSPSRFVRASLFSALTPEQATAEDAIWTGFHILDSFDIPAGTVPEPEGSTPPFEITEWTVMADMTNLKYYVWTEENRDIRMIDLGKLATEGTAMQTFPLDQQQSVVELGG
jgi:choloylglycine hydrolase